MKVKTFGFVLLVLLGIVGFGYFFLMIEKLTQNEEAENGQESTSRTNPNVFTFMPITSFGA